MNLRSLDLNLMVIFDAIYAERSISKASARLNLSQPAVSNALARLRNHLDDPLFKRDGKGVKPTPYAKRLKDPVRQALDILERGLRNDDNFEFSNSDREFVIGIEDYGEAMILPRFVDWLANTASNIRIRIQPGPASALQKELREGTVDMALDYFALQEPGINNKCILTDTLTTIARENHPIVGERLSLETYLSLKHIVIEPHSKTLPMIDLALSKRGLKRDICLTVPHFLSMPAVVEKTDLIGTLPRRMAYFYTDHFRLNAYHVPLHTPEYPIYLIWHKSFDLDPGHIWFRNHLIALCQSL